MSFLEQKYQWLFKFFDHNNNGSISIEDFIAKGERATEAVKEYFMSQENGSELVSSSLEVIHENQVNAYKQLFQQLIGVIDISEDGSISPEEWMTFCQSVASNINSNGSLPDWFETLLGNYFTNVLDSDGNGAIDFYELAFMGDAPVDLSWYCYDFLTSGGTNPLDKDQFINFAQQYFASEDEADPSRYLFGFVQA